VLVRRRFRLCARGWAGATALLGVASCAEPGATGGSVVRRDSAGVAIIESTAPRWGSVPAWRVDTIPVLDLTTTGEGLAHEFDRVSDATRLADGSIVVADEGAAEVRRYTPAGEFAGAFGRQGNGPGEFRRLTSVHAAAGDSLSVFDFWQGRLTIFRMGDVGARTADLAHLGTRVRRVSPIAPGRFAGLVHGYPDAAVRGLYRVPYTVVVFEPSSAVVDTVATVAGSEGYQFDHGDARPLFGRNGAFAVHHGEVFVGDGDSLRIDAYGADGTLRRIVRVPGFDLSLTDAERAAERAARLPDGPVPAFIREVADALPDPVTRPAYAGLHVDADGYVWAPAFHGTSEADRPIECRIFAPDGEWLGSLTLPARFTILEVGDDWILGVRRDALDVESVRVYHLDRSP
jgi:hypothetical protein